MDSVVIQSVKVRGRSLQRTLEPRRKRIHSTRRSGSRKSKHHDHFYQRLYGGPSKPLKTASMLTMMIASPFFIIFMQVPLPPPPARRSFLYLPASSFSPSLAALAFDVVVNVAIFGYAIKCCSVQCCCLLSRMSGSYRTV